MSKVIRTSLVVVIVLVCFAVSVAVAKNTVAFGQCQQIRDQAQAALRHCAGKETVWINPTTSMKDQMQLRSLTPARRTVSVPSAEFAIAVGTAALRPYSMRVQPELLHAIGNWLSQKFDLPRIAELPRVVFVPDSTIRTLRYGNETDLFGATDVAAVYGDSNETIYLPQGWTGSTVAELSILVHERFITCRI